MLELIRDAYRYRELIWVLTLKELKIRYKGSLLGYFWSLLNPLLMTAVYVVVFTVFARAGRFGIENYPIFLMCAIFPWFFGIPFHKPWLSLPVPLVGLALFAAGCGFVVSAANVFFRDTEHIVPVFLPAYLFFCSVIYDLRHIDPKYHFLLSWNPLLYALDGFRLAVFYGELPSAGEGGLTPAIG